MRTLRSLPVWTRLAITAVVLGILSAGLHVLNGFLKVPVPPPSPSSLGPVPVDVPRPVVVDTGLGRGVVLFEDEEWRLVRLVGSGYLEVFRRDRPDLDWQLLNLSLHWRKNTYPLAAVANNQGLHVIGYDTVANITSGRALSAGRNGVDVDLISSARHVRLASGLEIGGFDTRYEVHALPEGLVLAGTNRIVTIRGMSPPRFWTLEGMLDRQFVEVAFSGERAAAIVRRSHDDRVNGPLTDEFASYELAVLEPSGMRLEPIEAKGIPWRVRLDESGPSCEFARTSAELSSVFLHDLSRMSFGGIMDFGGNNLEGRVAWSQAYYLDALMESFSGRLAHLDLRHANSLRTRTAEELQLLVDVACSEWPGLRCQRYSLDREPLLFALHAGRILHVLNRARGSMPAVHGLGTAIEALRELAIDGTDTVERPAAIPDGEMIFQSLSYRQGLPFWADGCNTPYNHVSGVVNGVLSGEADASTVARCAEWMQPILRLEFGSARPNAWRYWWGLGDRGWTRDQGVSLNTLEYVGNAGSLADITYRSMDASAMLALERHRAGSLADGLKDHLHGLVEQGWLLPWVAGSFPDDRTRPKLGPAVLRRHARAAVAWELQGQVWCLDQLIAEGPPDD